MENFILEINKENYNIDFFMEEVQKNIKLKNYLVNELLTNKNELIYKNCYEILDKASLENPEQYYIYWNEFAKLLLSKNYLHREYGLILIANIISVDKDNLFEKINREYFNHINDKEFKVVNTCLKNINKISVYKKEYIEEITEIYLNIDDLWKFNEKQKEQMKFYIIRFFETFYNDINEKEIIVEYVKKLSSSINPRTRRRSKSSKLKKYYN